MTDDDVIGWYKFHAMHGGGHQGYTEEYLWVEYDPEEIDWSNWCDRAGLRNTSGGIEKEDPPPEIANKMAKRFKSRMDYFQTLIERLPNDPNS